MEYINEQIDTIYNYVNDNKNLNNAYGEPL